MRNYISFVFFTSIYLFSASSSYADIVVADDLVVRDSVCVGQDCVNGEAFTGEILKLKENNLRIGFVDTSASASPDDDWKLVANSSMNGGGSYMSVEVKELTFVLSDGTAIDWDCTVSPPVDTGLTIPAGVPVEDPNNNCLPIPDIVPESSFKLGTVSNNGVAIGHDSQLEADVVSVGRAALVRRIMHVAEGIAETELLTKGTMDEYAANGPVIERLDDIEDQLTELERVVNILSGSDVAASGTGTFNAQMLFLILMILLVQHYIRRLFNIGVHK